MQGKTYAFIDASNIIYGAKAEGWFIDLKKLISYLRKKYSVSEAYFYYGKDSNNQKKERFLKKLKKFDEEHTILSIRYSTILSLIRYLKTFKVMQLKIFRLRFTQMA